MAVHCQVTEPWKCSRRAFRPGVFQVPQFTSLWSNVIDIQCDWSNLIHQKWLDFDFKKLSEGTRKLVFIKNSDIWKKNVHIMYNKRVIKGVYHVPIDGEWSSRLLQFVQPKGRLWRCKTILSEFTRLPLANGILCRKTWVTNTSLDVYEGEPHDDHDAYIRVWEVVPFFDPNNDSLNIVFGMFSEVLTNGPVRIRNERGFPTNFASWFVKTRK